MKLKRQFIENIQDVIYNFRIILIYKQKKALNFRKGTDFDNAKVTYCF